VGSGVLEPATVGRQDWVRPATVAAPSKASCPPETVKASAKLEVDFIVSDPPETTKSSPSTVSALTVYAPALSVTVCRAAVSIRTLSVATGSRAGLQSAVVLQSPSASTAHLIVVVGIGIDCPRTRARRPATFA